MNFEEAIAKLQAAAGDAQKLALATVEVVLTSHEPGLRQALEAAVVPHWFTPEILAVLTESGEATASDQMEKLNRLPMVEAFPARGGWNVHEATRLALRSALAKEQPGRFLELSARAASCFLGTEPHHRVESIYHRLVATPPAAAEDLERLRKEWDTAGRYEALQALGLALSELLRTELLAPPARARSALCFGLVCPHRLTVGEAERLARDAVALFRDLGNESGEADAHDLLGDVLNKQGRLADALAEYEASKRIMLGLIQRAPDNTSWQRELSVLHGKVGGVYQAQGRLAEALREYEADKNIMLGLTQRDPDNTDWQRDLSVSHNSVGGVYQTQGRLAEALWEYEAYKQIMLRLTQRDPDNTDWQRDLSVSYNKAGGVYRAQGRLAEALREYEVYRQIMLGLTQRDPDNTDWQRELSVSYNNVGSVYQRQGRLAEALREYEACKQIRLGLTQRDPNNTSWQRDLSVSHNTVGGVYQAQGRLADALREFEAALVIAQRLAAHDPSNAQWQKDLEIVLDWVASLRTRLSR